MLPAGESDRRQRHWSTLVILNIHRSPSLHTQFTITSSPAVRQANDSQTKKISVHHEPRRQYDVWHSSLLLEVLLKCFTSSVTPFSSIRDIRYILKAAYITHHYCQQVHAYIFGLLLARSHYVHTPSCWEHGMCTLEFCSQMTN